MTVFTPQERRVVLFLLATLVAGSAVKLYRSRNSNLDPHPASDHSVIVESKVDTVALPELDTIIKRVEERLESPSAPDLRKMKIDINTASERELSLLPGIGPKLAARIATHRESHGLFRNAGQLTEVQGIGEKKLASIAEMIEVSPVPTAVFDTTSRAK